MYAASCLLWNLWEDGESHSSDRSGQVKVKKTLMTLILTLLWELTSSPSFVLAPILFLVLQSLL